jgi:O-antigen/teichoic acid export membrane protein
VGSAVVLFQHHYGVWSLLIANLLDAIFIHAVSVFFIRRIAGRNILAHVGFEKQRLQRLLDFGSWVFGASILNTVIYPLNRVFITRYAGVAAVPIYDISLATAFKIRSFFESGFRSLTPEFSRVQAARPIEAQGYLAAADHKGLKVVVFLGTPVYLVVFAVCGFGLKLWLGARFTPEIPQIFRVLLIGTYLGLWGLQPWYSLLGFGRSRDILGSNAIQALAGLTYIIAAPRSLETVAIGTSLGMLASTLYLRVQASKLRSGFSGFRKRHPCVFNHFPG